MNIYWTIAFRNLKRHWRKSLAALLSISMGFMTMVLFGGYMNNTRQLMFTDFRHRMMLGDVNIEKKDLWSAQGRSEPWRYRLDKKDQNFLEETLRSFPEVETWANFLRVSGMVTNGNKSSIFMGIGYDLATGAKVRSGDWYWNVLYGVPLEESEPTSVLLGQSLAKKLGCLPAPKAQVQRASSGYEKAQRPFKCENSLLQFSAMTPSGQISALDLDVVGLVDGGFRDLDSRFLYFPLEKAQSLAHTEDISYVSVLLKDPGQTPEFVKRLQETSDQKGFNLTIKDWRDHHFLGDSYRKTNGLMSIYRDFVSLIILSIAGLSVLNTLLKIVRERTREIGTLRSIGFTRQELVKIFVAEAMTLGIAGSIFGAVVSMVFTTSINSLNILYKAGLFVEPIPFAVDIVPLNYLISAVILIFVCFLAAMRATQNVLKRSIAQNLIHN